MMRCSHRSGQAGPPTENTASAQEHDVAVPGISRPMRRRDVGWGVMENSTGRLWRWILDAVVKPPPTPVQEVDYDIDLRVWENAAELLADEFAYAD